jgi:UDP-glucose 4-epimerase
MRKNILITGGLGYIGSSLSNYFIENNNYNVYITSRRQKELPEILKKSNVILLDVNGSEQELHDKLKGIDIIIHLAALNENDSISNPELAIHVNVTGTLKILKAAIVVGVKKIIYFSTAHVYSSPLESHLTEEKCTFPTHPYAITHRAAEDFLLSAHKQKKIEVLVIRLSNALGAPIHKSIDRWTLLVNDLCKQIAETNKIVLRSSGVQVRNFITLKDVCRAILHLLEIKEVDFDYPVYNLGGPNTLSVNQVTEIISLICEKKYGYRPEIQKADIKENVVELVYDSSKIANTGFEWENNIELEIEETLTIAHKFFSKVV